MKKQSLYAAGASFVYFITALGVPASAAALPDSPIVITEVQPGSSTSASEEFIELLNISNETIDLSANHWQLITASASAKDWAPYRTVTLNGILSPGATYIVASTYTQNGTTQRYLADQADMAYAAGLSATGGHVRLTYTANAVLADGTCGPAETIADTLEWSTYNNGVYQSPSITGRTVFKASAKTGIMPSDTMQRLFDFTAATVQDTDNDEADFVAAPATLRALYAPLLSYNPSMTMPSFPIDRCDLPLPDPSSGTGPTEPSDPLPSPSDGGSGGSGAGDGTGESPATGTEGALEPSPQPGAINEGLAAPVITEILPNPASPQTDADDEFIELYNPNDAAFDLSGYRLEAGGVTLRTYTFAAGSLLAPHAYQSFTAPITGLSLPNSGGSVRLIDTVGTEAARAESYGTAPDGQAWALTDGVWKWTTSPTPSAANIAVAVPAPVQKATTAAAKKTTKATAVKAAATSKPKVAKTATPKAKKAAATATKAQLSTVSSTSMRSPVHIGVLAAIGVFALLYGAYEYRHDLANKIKQLRSNRAARRAARQAAARR